MPNTLCHIALQTPATKLLWRDSSFLLIVAACIIPDIPWILQRLLLVADLFNPYDVRLYFSVQASYLFCTLLIAALAACSPRPQQVFAVGALNALLHLLLDASQLKWANGVHLLAPFSWQPVHYGRLWPEHMFWTTLTLAGGCTFVFFWLQKKTLRIGAPVFTPVRMTLGYAALLLYGLAPLVLMNGIEQSGSYFIATLRDREARVGKYVEFDRAPFTADSGSINTFADEQLFLEPIPAGQCTTISIKGHFVSARRIKATAYHCHNGFRDYASLAGLFMACALLLHSLLLSRKKIHGPR